MAKVDISNIDRNKEPVTVEAVSLNIDCSKIKGKKLLTADNYLVGLLPTNAVLIETEIKVSKAGTSGSTVDVLVGSTVLINDHDLTSLNSARSIASHRTNIRDEISLKTNKDVSDAIFQINIVYIRTDTKVGSYV